MVGAFGRLGLVSCVVALLWTPAEASPGPGELTRTRDGYRWVRGEVRFDLKDRKQRWSRDEATILRDCLDRLPDVLLRKAMTMRVRTLYRDQRPIGRNGKPKSTASATTVLTKGYISFGDKRFKGLDAKAIYRTVVHEFGHVAQYAVIGGSPAWARARAKTLGTPGFTTISWTNAVTQGLKSYNGFVSDYARKRDREDFAESVEFYWLNPAELKRVNARKYRYMRDRVFEGEHSPKASRDTSHKAIGKVRPEIQRLGDHSDDVFSLVKVHGKHFMGPTDGGFNRVRYRGKRALHVPVSRSTIWSWVPALKRGSAPVTVTTQDGRSASAAFRVTKPWWKFW